MLLRPLRAYLAAGARHQADIDGASVTIVIMHLWTNGCPGMRQLPA